MGERRIVPAPPPRPGALRRLLLESAALFPIRRTMTRWPMLPVLALLSAAAVHAEAPPKPARLGLCAACHGESGVALAPGIPHLAGQNREYLVAALRQYRSGERTAQAMRTVSGSLSDADIDALAAWYAAQPGAAR
jgi:cytochrome c553